MSVYPVVLGSYAHCTISISQRIEAVDYFVFFSEKSMPVWRVTCYLWKCLYVTFFCVLATPWVTCLLCLCLRPAMSDQPSSLLMYSNRWTSSLMRLLGTFMINISKTSLSWLPMGPAKTVNIQNLNFTNKTVTKLNCGTRTVAQLREVVKLGGFATEHNWKDALLWGWQMYICRPVPTVTPDWMLLWSCAVTKLTTHCT